ncbi:peptidylprolyl isomerase [Pacificibacter sp. AS14]|uniref:peptidylprolyl isomerase n=1 Tax=Pacificibacter sp. AS14 TaxID=3135785 RepID=UPI00317AAC1E
MKTKSIRSKITGFVQVACLFAVPFGGSVLPVNAQNLFAPVAQVNDSVVTAYELQQRVQLMSVLGGGVTDKVALDSLIDERLKVDAAKRANIEPDDKATAKAIDDFASRGNLAPEQFLSLLNKNGVSNQTFRDFVVSGLAWRDYARARFVSRVNVSESDIDRALRDNGPSGGLLVSMSEIFLPARDDKERAASELLAKQIAANPSIAAFAAAARKYSVAPSGKEKSGRMSPTPLGNLPAPLRTAATTLKPGEVSAPLSTGNAIGIFQLRGLSEIDTPTPRATSIEYAAYYIAGGRSESGLKAASKLRASVDTCDDLYGIAKGSPASVLDIDTLPLSEIPADVAKELAQLDPGESSIALTRSNGETLVFLMLCERTFEKSANVDRETVKSGLQSARIGAMADSHLAELRADATIVRK